MAWGPAAGSKWIRVLGECGDAGRLDRLFQASVKPGRPAARGCGPSRLSGAARSVGEGTAVASGFHEWACAALDQIGGERAAELQRWDLPGVLPAAWKEALSR
ncbi:hypothetical protein GCM10010299_20550 [Streptomyces tanashiensis]|nr:hypothetical protein GCM10010299_20550 [Streptomyces tanashiensis]